jgi:hypothetical protein
MFGLPVRVGFGRRGKPPHVKCVENVNDLNRLLAFGWSNERIAGAMGISLPTLRKYYVSELKRRAMARDALDLKLATRLWEQVEKGNVGAMREYQKLLERNDRMGTARAIATDDPQTRVAPAASAMSAKGKKAGAAETAVRILADDPDLNPGIPGLLN